MKNIAILLQKIYDAIFIIELIVIFFAAAYYSIETSSGS